MLRSPSASIRRRLRPPLVGLEFGRKALYFELGGQPEHSWLLLVYDMTPNNTISPDNACRLIRFDSVQGSTQELRSLSSVQRYTTAPSGPPGIGCGLIPVMASTPRCCKPNELVCMATDCWNDVTGKLLHVPLPAACFIFLECSKGSLTTPKFNWMGFRLCGRFFQRDITIL
ncbi:hypothetical protein B0H12DRAFT_1149658 [Mycena haematopus]|nr:hypothetical protein B0H12DRAFT_1149658 [Mycena haematopus]